MKKTLMLSTAIILGAATAPASAQLLGGGGLGGVVGGSVGGIVGPIGTAGSIGNALDSAGRLRVDRSIDSRQGRARAGAEGGGSVAGAIDGATSSTLGSAGLTGNARASGSGRANASADGPGTAAIGNTVGQAVGRVRETADHGRNTATNVALGAVSGNAGGSAAGSGRAGGSAGGSSLAGAGSAAGEAAGSLAVSPGMLVKDGSGQAIGTVSEIRSTSDGYVDSVIVTAGDRIGEIDGSDLRVSGDALVAAMSTAEIYGASEEPQQN